MCATDGVPIIGELKRKNDRLPYYALVQLLAHAVELASPGQRNRLQQAYGDRGMIIPESGPVVDLYSIFYKPPSNWTHLDQTTQATCNISAALLRDQRVDQVIRRIVLLEAVPTGDALQLRTVFAHGPGTSGPTTARAFVWDR